MTKSRKPRGIKATADGVQRMKDERKYQGLTNEKISEWTYEQYGNAGVSQSSVDNFITKNKPVQPGIVEKITATLGLKPEDVVDPDEWRVVTRQVKRDLESPPDIHSQEKSPQADTQYGVLENRHNLSHLDCHNLPPQHNPFIGRQNELCELMRLLSADHPARIIQVDGIAGVGKTALVLEAAYRCLEYKFYGETQNPISQHGNYICEIAQFELIIFVSAKESELLNGNSVKKLMVTRTLQEIYRTIADVLDDPLIINMDINDKNNQYFSIIKKCLKNQGNVLLIVDNLETIKEKDKVLAFLYELPIKSVITTRERNTFTPIRLDSLTDAESISLIDQQIEEKSINYLTSDQKKLLCRATRGIPLAIIYSIGRLATGIKIDHIVDSLEPQRGKDLLPTEDEELAGFSFQEEEFVAFCFKKSVNDIKGRIAYKILMTIAIYKSPACEDSIRAVAGLETQPDRIVNEEIALLRQISLIRYNNSKGRYRMLPLTREYVLSELQKNQEFKNEALNRWVNWYIEFTKKQYEYENKPERFIIGYENLEQEWPNIVGVLLFCKDDFRYEQLKEIWSYLNNYTNLRGRWKDRLSWLSYLSEMSMLKGDYSTAVNTMSRRGRTLLLMGKPEQLREAEKLLLKAWDLRDYASFEDLDYLLNHLAGLYSRLEKYEDAHQWLDLEQDNLNANINLSDQEKCKYKIYIYRERAELFFVEGNYQKSKSLCEQILKNTYRITNGLRNANYVRKILADIAINENQLERAEELLKLIHEEAKANKDKRRIAYCQVSFAKLEKAKNKFPKALNHIQNALNNFDYLGMMRDHEQALSLYKEIIDKLSR